MRFHFGVSFRWKTIKKFLIPILFGLLSYFGFNGFLGVIKVNALANYDTTTTLEYGDFYETNFDDSNNGGVTFKEFLDTLIKFYEENDSYYDIVLYNVGSNTSYDIALIPKKTNRDVDVSIYAYSNTYFNSSIYDYMYRFEFPLNSEYNILESNWYNTLKSCLSSNTCPTSSSSSNGFSYTQRLYTSFSLFSTVSPSSAFESCSNNVDCVTKLPVIPFYYSSLNFIFNPTSAEVRDRDIYLKKISFLGNVYNVGDRIDSYSEISADFVNPLKKNKNSYGEVYFNIDKNNLSNFSFTTTFKTIAYAQDYVLNTAFTFKYFGRVVHENYYTYEPIKCTLPNNSFAYNQNEHDVSLAINHFNCTSDLTNYDKIYGYFDWYKTEQDEFSLSVYDVEYSSTNGNTYVSEFLQGAELMEEFKLLPSNFKFGFSSTSSFLAMAHVFSSTDYTLAQGYNNDSLEPIKYEQENSRNDKPIKFIYGNKVDTIYSVYNDYSRYLGFTDLKIFMDSSTLLSFDNSLSTELIYYDKEGNIVSNSLNMPMDYDYTNNQYNLDNYFLVVSKFLDNISADVSDFASVVQNTYNLIPDFIAQFIFVLFILSCVYMLYKIIKR